MKKLFSIACLAVIICLSQVVPASSADVFQNSCPAGSTATLCQEAGKTQTQADNSLFGANGVITKGTRLIAMVVGVASTIMIIIGGLQYILASGDPSNVNNAKNTILYAIIGLVVAIAAQAIVVFILGGIR